MTALSWRGGVLAGVILLHAGAVAALQGLGREPAPPQAVTAPPVLVAAILTEREPAPAPAPAPPPPEPRPQVRAAPRAAKPLPTPPAAPVAATPALAPAAAPPSPVAAPAEAAPVPARPPLQEPAAISCRVPAYPAEAKRRGETGTVLLHLLIDTEGAVIDQRVEHSSGHAALDDAAMAALSKCRFKPGTLDGRPQQAWAKLRYVWKLE